MRHIIPCIALSLFFATSCSKPARPHFQFQPLVTVGKPVVKTVPYKLTYPGYIEAYKTVQVQTQISGLLTGMYFEEGSEVKEGELLFTIDSRPYRATLDKAEAALAEAVAALKLAEDTALRYAKLLQDEYVAQLTYDQYLTDVTTQQCNVQMAQADVETAKLNLLYTTIYSPINAIAGKKMIDVGNYVTVGENPYLISLNQINPIFASFYVPDVDLPLIQSYQKSGELKTMIYLNEDPSMGFEGKLTLIDNQVSTSTGTIFMKATICNDSKKLWPGEFVEIDVILKNIENAILVPVQAVQIGQDGKFVFTLDENDVASMKPVKTGQRIDDMIVIEEGIQKDDRLIIDGQISVSPGDKVVIKETSSTPTVPNNSSVSSSSVKEYLKGVRSNKTATPHLEVRSIR